jgi:DNA-binding response OmpR family regulator/anti-sigma regulatory factor (Ser/Thr protein kinase)
VIKRNALRLQSLVDQLLDLSKLDNGKMQLSVCEGNIIQFIRSIVFSFESLAERKHIHFHSSFPAELEMAYFDRDKLEKVLVNLLSNAFKFTPEHGTIRVIVEKHQGRLKIQVGDSGPGMGAEDIEKVFDRFYQVEGTEAKGTGIGLALVKELVNLHNGQISVDSRQGEGTNFKIVLPYRQTDFPAETLFISPPPEEFRLAASAVEMEQAQSTHRPSTLQEDQPVALIVEDNADLRHYIRENIQAQYQVLIAQDGLEGLQIATEKIPDIIISDVMMPKKSGFEMCQALKTDQRTSHIPIILLTAKAGQDHKIEGLEQGADDYLTKPFDVRELNIRMTNLIDQRQRLREKFGAELQIRPSQVRLSSVDEQFMKSVIQEVEKNLDNEFFTVEELARSVGFSRSQLHRKLKALTNKSANQLIREFRLTRAREMLEQKAASVSEVAYQVGYSNLSYFSKSFKEAFGKLPSELD